MYGAPFLGGGAIFFAKKPSTVELVNDCKGERINCYEVFQRDFMALEKEVAIGNVLVIRGYGLKIGSDPAHEAQTCVFFQSVQDAQELKAQIIPVNEPRTLKVIMPAGLTAGIDYFLQIAAMSSAKGSIHILKEVREMKSDFHLTAQA